MASDIDLEPLTTPTIDTPLQSGANFSMEFTSMNLCFLNNEEANIRDQLVIQSESFGTTEEDYLIKVKTVEGDTIIEVDKEHVKVERYNNIVEHMYVFIQCIRTNL